jgi:hypothetical protein
MSRCVVPSWRVSLCESLFLTETQPPLTNLKDIFPRTINIDLIMINNLDSYFYSSSFNIFYNLTSILIKAVFPVGDNSA